MRVRAEVLSSEYVKDDKHHRVKVCLLDVLPRSIVEVRLPQKTSPGDIVWITQ